MRTVQRHAFVRAALVGTLSAVLVCGGIGHALAEDDDELPDQKVMRHIMQGLGLKRPGVDKDIEYRERSPLVVPPTRDLPPPETTSAVDQNPAWPDDPDVKARREAKAKQRIRQGVDWEAEGRAIPRRELDRPDATRTAGAEPGSTKSVEESSKPIKPSELGYGGGLFSWRSLIGAEPAEEYGTFTREPERTDLTQPPPGYLTPSAAQPYGVSKESEKRKATPADQAVGSAATK